MLRNLFRRKQAQPPAPPATPAALGPEPQPLDAGALAARPGRPKPPNPGPFALRHADTHDGLQAITRGPPPGAVLPPPKSRP